MYMIHALTSGIHKRHVFELSVLDKSFMYSNNKMKMKETNCKSHHCYETKALRKVISYKLLKLSLLV